ncbi:MAG: serine/threonine-protein kinase, partial [Planctomycetota bacterium]|nr:serine/threonine-protein kinase [Planctomycetota bacterium]
LRERIEDPQFRLHQYILSEEVGSGGMGSVWKAWDIKLSRWVAIKFLNLTDQESIIRFRREAKMTARLRHPNIAGVYEVNVTEGTHYLVMEFIEGKPFQKIECSVKEIAKTFIKVCKAIAYAHENDTVHRDIKPANILVNDAGEPFVTDFGLAKGMHSNTSLSITGSIMGTPAYMSPEQATGSLKEIDERSDVYSLGATLYTLVSKKAPFKADNPTALLFKVCSEEPESIRSVNPQITQELENIIFKSMSKKKEERYESATEFADDLERFLGDEQVEAQKRKRIRKRVPTTVLAAIIVLVLGGFTVIAWNLGYLDAYIKPKGITENPPNTPTPTEIAQEWLRNTFPQIKSTYAFREFSGKPPQNEKELRAILKEAPEEALNDMEGWFRSQQSLIPSTLWDKSRWLQKKEEAKTIQAWCLSVTALLADQQTQWEDFQKSLETDRVRFLPVIAYLGKINLKLYVWPYAEIRGLQVGETWFIRDGKRTESEISLLGEKLSTPLVIENLDIGNIKLTLSHPELGIQETTVSAEKLENGKTFLLTGKLKDPGSIRIRELP